MKRKGTRWRVDWFGGGAGPDVGQLIVRMTPSGRKSFARITGIRSVANRRQLPKGASGRFMVTVERVEAHDSSEIDWVLHTYPRKRKSPTADPYTDPMSPLL